MNILFYSVREHNPERNHSEHYIYCTCTWSNIFRNSIETNSETKYYEQIFHVGRGFPTEKREIDIL